CVDIEIEPHKGANGHSEQRHKSGEEDPFLRPETIVYERRRIHADERDERSEVQHLRAFCIGQQERAAEGDDSEQYDIIAGNSGTGIDGSEEAPWQSLLAAHAIKQASGAELGRDTR